MNEYMQNRRYYQDISGSSNIAVGDVSKTLKAVRNASYQIFIQKIHVRVTTGNAGKTWDVQDTAGTPVSITGAIDVTAIGTTELDFGPRGMPLTAAKDLKIALSAAGAIGVVTWEGYQRLASTIAAGAGLD